MKIVCTICTDAVTEDFAAAPCGHTFHYTCLTQWLAHQKTCPQCRERCLQRNVVKLFVDSGDSSMLNTTQSMEPQEMKEKLSLQENLLKHKEKALSEARESLEEIRKEMQAWRTQHEATHRKLKTEQAANSTIRKQLGMLQYQCDQAKEEKKELSLLKEKLNMMEGLRRVLSDSKEEVEGLVKNYKSPAKLASFVVAMKRDYEVLKDKKTAVQKEKDKLSQEMSLMKKQLHGRELELQRCRSRLEVVESDLHAAEQERESLQRKVELLETALESPGSRLALRRILESPMPDGNKKVQVDLGASPLLAAHKNHNTQARTGDAQSTYMRPPSDKPQAKQINCALDAKYMVASQMFSLVIGSKRGNSDDGVLLPVNKTFKHSSSKSFACGFNGMGGQTKFAIPKSKPPQKPATKGLKFAPRMTTHHKLKSSHPPPPTLQLNFH